MENQSNIIRPYITIPVYFEQPTWGGTCIAEFSTYNEKYPVFKTKKIGQSYELYEGTSVLLDIKDSQKGTADEGDHKNPTIPIPLDLSYSRTRLSDIIHSNPVEILGQHALRKHGKQIGILIKFTQAKSNSYQLHVAKKEGRWKPKPESWYYLKPGIITLGIKPNIDWTMYEKRCRDIEAYGMQISYKIKKEKLSISTAKLQFQNYIQSNHPKQFVNTYEVPQYCAIDLSKGQIHHSWEEDPIRYPDGNIVYEVQKNVYDDESTLRSFDQGKLKDDGSVRPLTITEYFTYINRSLEANDPKNYIKKPKLITKKGIRIMELFRTYDYALETLEFNGACPDAYTVLESSYHHMFVTSGKILVTSANNSYSVSQGHAVFIPSGCKNYTMSSIPGYSSSVLRTYVPS